MVCLSDTVVICAKTAEPIEMPFGFWIRVVAGSDVLDDGLDSACEVAILTGKGASYCKVYGLPTVRPAITAVSIKMPFRIWTRVGFGGSQSAY